MNQILGKIVVLKRKKNPQNLPPKIYKRCKDSLKRLPKKLKMTTKLKSRKKMRTKLLPKMVNKLISKASQMRVVK